MAFDMVLRRVKSRRNRPRLQAGRSGLDRKLCGVVDFDQERSVRFD